MHTRAFMGINEGRVLCMEKPYVQLDVWGRLAQWLQE